MTTQASLSNLHVGTFHVLDRAKPEQVKDRRKRPHFWCLCQCGNEQMIRAQSITRAQAGKEELRCKACWA